MKLDLRRRTKIVCTIGPATSSPAMVERLIKSGMNVARLNMSHGTHQEHAGSIGTIRRIAAALGLPIAILQDLPGPKCRTGKLKDGQVALRQGSRLVLTSREVPGDAEQVSVNLPTLPQDVRRGNTVLIDDGAIQLKVEAVTESDIRCKVVVGGLLKPSKGVTVPGMRISSPYVTQETLVHLRFGIDHRVDYMALSFVGERQHVVQIRELLRESGAQIPIVAKIERREAVRNFDEILDVSDGIMVARGDLGVEIPLPRVPVVQKEIIRKCNRAGKPVITATQMLESMVNSPRPTRAEVTDVANAIYDGSDAVMLSAETSIGQYPVQAVTMMSRIARETEAALPYRRMLLEKGADLEPETDDAISYDACHTAHQLGARAIVAFTTSGSTAQRVSKYRPQVPILALTPSDLTRRRLAMVWGVHPFQVVKPDNVADLFAQAATLAKELGVAKSGDLVVVTGGVPIGVAGTTNLLKVETIT